MTIILSYGFFVLAACFAICLFKLVSGPKAIDRAAVLIVIGILSAGICAVLSLSGEANSYIDIAIAWVVQTFIIVLCLAKHLEGRSFDA